MNKAVVMRMYLLALAVTLVCLGLMERDGALMLIGTAAAVIAMVIAVTVVGAILAASMGAIEYLWPGFPLL